ncbi:MAG: MFS transporter [DPANN group archaeon]|nr:MFS transporter [DPANN group archaeon]
MHDTFKEVHKIEKNLKSVPKSLKLLSLAFLIYSFSWGMILPYFSIYLARIVPNYSQVGFIISLMSIVAAVISIVIGDLIDKVGRKKILIFAFINYLVIGPIYTVTHSIATLLAARIYHGVAEVGIWIPGCTYVRDISPAHKKAEYMGYFCTASALAYTIGPVFGALVITFFDMKFLFYIVGFAAVVAAIIVQKIPESVKPKRSMLQGIKDVMFKDKFIAKEFKDYTDEKSLGIKVTMISFLSKMSSAILIMTVALYINSIGGSLWQIGLVYSLMYMPFVFQFVFGVISDTLGPKKVLAFGAILSCTFFSALFFANNIVYILIFTFLGSLGLAMVGPVVSGYISVMAKKNNGEITGIYGAISDMAAFTGPLVAGLIADMYGLNFVFIAAAIAMSFVIGIATRM